MTHDERLFIQYRYFMEKDMEVVPILINWSRREVFRLRQSVLAKTKWLLSLGTKKRSKDQLNELYSGTFLALIISENVLYY
jgi:hypothetical protein